MSMGVPELLGLVGDTITFASGVLLAIDAMRAERDFTRAKAIVRGLKNPVMQNVKVELEGLIVVDEEGVQQAFLHRSSRTARGGMVMLAMGFACLLESRIVDSLNH